MTNKIMAYILIFSSIFCTFIMNSQENTDIDATSAASEILEDIPKLDDKNPEKNKPRFESKIDDDAAKTEKTVIEKPVIPETETKAVEKVENETEKKIKKEEDIKIQTAMIDDIIVLRVENLKDNEILENKYRETRLIIFENGNENIPSSLSFEMEEEKVSDTRYYESENFIPKNVREFELAKPAYVYDAEKIINPGKYHISTELGENVFRMAFEEFKKGDMINSLDHFEKLINYGHRIPESAYYAGLCYYLNRDNIKAINFLKYAVRAGIENNIPQNQISVFLYQTGNIYYELDDAANALENFFTALEKNPDNANIYNGIGLAYYKTGDTDNALANWKKGKDAGNANCTANYNWLISKIGN